ncbi:MAG: DUF1289 domain-containing protein [Gammaproteobacteria bacterium]
MSTDPQRVAPAGPLSPCINVCALDAKGVCSGCLRTVDEIARWTTMSAEEQWRVVAALAERRRHFHTGGLGVR